MNDDNIKFLNDNRVMLVLSLDGKKETHDAMRPFPNKAGSYDAAVRGFKKVIDSREGKTTICAEPIPISVPISVRMCWI